MAELEIKYLPLSSVVLDERNPRVAPTRESIDSPVNEDWIALALGQSAPSDEDGTSTTYDSLKASIESYRGLMQPIIVSPSGEKYVVIEGNTRVAIFRELQRDEETGPWNEIPAIVRKLDEAGEHAIRLQAHLVGPRPWRPYAKAKYLHDLYHQKKLSVEQIFNYCGGTGRKREIEEYIKAYEDMQNYYVPILDGAPPEYTRFSAFVELQRPGVGPAIVAAGFTKTDFAKWVKNGNIDPLNTVRKLGRILANPEAKKKFLTYNAREALKILDQPPPNQVIKDASIEQLANALAVKLRKLDWQEARAIIEDPSGPRAEALRDCFEELKGVCVHIEPNQGE